MVRASAPLDNLDYVTPFVDWSDGLSRVDKILLADAQPSGGLLVAYGACEGDPNYNPNADFDGNGCVDLSDLAALLANYGVGT